MSSTLDLNGGTHTISSDTEETYHQVVDTSANHDGTLVIESGASLIFDDKADAGFSPDWVGTFTISGTADSPATIRSEDTNPHHPFTMALGVSGTWTRCRIAGNAAFSSSGTLILNNIIWGYDSYCGVDDVRRLTGILDTQLSDADISAIIEMAVNEIDDYTGKRWYTGTATNEDHDYWGGGFVQATHYPIQSITTLSYRGGDAFGAKTEGAENDFYASPDDLRRGIIRLISEPSEDYQAIRITYIFGDATTKGVVRKLCTLIAAHDALLATQSPQKAGTLQARLDTFERQIKSLKSQLGGKLRPWPGDNAGEYTYPKGRISEIRAVGRY